MNGLADQSPGSESPAAQLQGRQAATIKEKHLSDDPTNGVTEWKRVWYQNAHSDMRWAKEQGWRALQWAVILFVAIGAAAAQLPKLPGWVFVKLTLLTTAVAIYYVVELQQFGKSSRETAEGLVTDIEERSNFLPKRHFDPHHYRWLVVRIVVVLVAMTFTLMSIDARPVE